MAYFTRLVPLTNQDILTLSGDNVITDISSLMENLSQPITTKLNQYKEDTKRNTIFSHTIFQPPANQSPFDKEYGYNYGRVELSYPYINVLGITGASPLCKILSISSKHINNLAYGKSILIVPSNDSAFKRILSTSTKIQKTEEEVELSKVINAVQLKQEQDTKIFGYLVTLKTNKGNSTLDILRIYHSIEKDIVLSGAYAFAFLLSFITPQSAKADLDRVLLKEHSELTRNTYAQRLKYVNNIYNHGSILDYILYYYPVVPLKYRDYTQSELGDRLDVMNIIPHTLMVLNLQLNNSGLHKPTLGLLHQINETVVKYNTPEYSFTQLYSSVQKLVTNYYAFFINDTFLSTINKTQEVLHKYIYSDLKDKNGQPVKDPKSKSLLVRCTKKTGIIRDSGLSKRVDYSGRSVIVSNPNLELDYISIPYDIVRVWFKDLLITTIQTKFNHLRLERSKIQSIIANFNPKPINHTNPNPELEEIYKTIKQTLDTVVKSVGVVSIRYPSLHKWNTLGSKIIVDYDTKAIGIHPLIVSSYNADFDGDQKAEILIQTKEGVKELEAVMLPSKNLYDAFGNPRHMPSQECVSGLYVATRIEDYNNLNPIKTYINLTHLESDYRLGHINISDIVRILNPNKISTVGRFLLQYQLPPQVDLDKIIGTEKGLTKGKVGELLKQIIELYFDDSQTIRTYHDIIKDFGYQAITRYGLSLSLSDLQEPTNRKQLIEDYEKDYIEIANNKTLSDVAKYNKQIDVGMKFSKDMLQEVKTTLKSNNPIRILIDSGSRGSWTGAVQLLGARGIMEDPNGKYIPKAVTTNFTSGISLDNGIIGSYGGANGSVSKCKSTEIAGELARDLVYALHKTNITQGDCGDTEGTLITPILTKSTPFTRDFQGNLYIRKNQKLEPVFIFNITNVGKNLPETYVTFDGDIIYTNIAIYNIYTNKILDIYNYSKPVVDMILKEIHDSNINLYTGTCCNGYTLKEFKSFNDFTIIDDSTGKEYHYLREFKPKDILGRIVCQDIEHNNQVLFKKGDYIPHDFDSTLLLQALSNYPNGIRLRSPLSCKSNNGLCAKCFGVSQVDFPKTIVPVGTAVGMLVAHITGERFTQTSMQVFHTGGTALGGSNKELFNNANKIIKNKTVINKELTEKLIVKDITYQQDYTSYKPNVTQAYKDIYSEHKAIPSGKPISYNYSHLGIVNNGIYCEATKRYLEAIRELFTQSGLYLDSIYLECLINSMFSVVQVIDASTSKTLHTGSNITIEKFFEENKNLALNNQPPALAVSLITSVSSLSSSVGSDNTLLKITYRNLKTNLTEGIANYGLVDSPTETNNILPIVTGKTFPIGKSLRKKLVSTYTHTQQGTLITEKPITQEVHLIEKDISHIKEQFNQPQPSPQPQTPLPQKQPQPQEQPQSLPPVNPTPQEQPTPQTPLPQEQSQPLPTQDLNTMFGQQA